MKDLFFLKAKAGFTLIELAIVLAIIGILASVAIPRLLDTETRDAALVGSVQAGIQAVVSQATARQDLNLKEIDPVRVRDEVLRNLEHPQQLSFTALSAGPGSLSFQLSILKTERRATYAVQPNGDAYITSLKGFSHYAVNAGGDIYRLGGS